MRVLLFSCRHQACMDAQASPVAIYLPVAILSAHLLAPRLDGQLEGRIIEAKGRGLTVAPAKHPEPAMRAARERRSASPDSFPAHHLSWQETVTWGCSLSTCCRWASSPSACRMPHRATCRRLLTLRRSMEGGSSKGANPQPPILSELRVSMAGKCTPASGHSTEVKGCGTESERTLRSLRRGKFCGQDGNAQDGNST
jgi:hypothetical protein